MSDVQLGYDEVVDTIADIIEVSDKVGKALADGVGLNDLGTIIEVTPRLNEIIRDGKTAIAQLKDLDTDEADAAAEAIATRTGKPKTGIISRANRGLKLIARTYRHIDVSIDLFEDWREFVESFKDLKGELA